MDARATIAAPVTPPGHGGVGIVRVSGELAEPIGTALAGPLPAPHYARLRRFRDARGATLDQGLALWLPAPYSYTGEDTLELHGHGGPAVIDTVLARCVELGARPARPGEFTERAFLNGRLDLAQAEAVADLIASSDAAGARAALRSLEGDFSRAVHDLRERLTGLRAWIEAALDFPEDEIDFLADTALRERLEGLVEAVARTRANADRGRRLVEGQIVVIAGAPNAGKSSLLNALAGTDSAIVTEVPGTTRDLLRESIHVDGCPLTLIDTAGLRQTADPIESEGVRRAEGVLAQADRVLFVQDSTVPDPEPPALHTSAIVDWVRTKIDLSGEPPGVTATATGQILRVSATTGAGLDALRAHLRGLFDTGPQSGAFSARRRHLDSLARADAEIQGARSELLANGAGELAAERLRRAQQALGEITGETTTEDLLGEIFSRFCIGK